MPDNKKTKATRRAIRYRRRIIHSNPTRIDFYPVVESLGDKVKTPAQLRAQLRKVCDDDLLWELMDQAHAHNRKRQSLSEAMTKRIVALKLK